MKYKKICFQYKKKDYKIEVKNCNFIQRFVGLMFIRKEKAKALLFDFGKNTNTPIHSYFVFFDFMAIWTDEFGNVLEVKLVRPFNLIVRPKKPFSKLIEIPLNKNYRDFSVLVGN